MGDSLTFLKLCNNNINGLEARTLQACMDSHIPGRRGGIPAKETFQEIHDLLLPSAKLHRSDQPRLYEEVYELFKCASFLFGKSQLLMTRLQGCPRTPSDSSFYSGVSSSHG